jgi:uncharacterized protein involved in exopolysaccharide biosynthesis
MSKENKSEKEQITEFFLYCLKNWYYFVISMIICTAIAVVYLKVTKPVMEVLARVSLRSDDSLTGGGGLSKSQSLMSAIGMGSRGVNVEDESLKMSSQGYVKKVVERLELNKVYTLSEFVGFKKTKLYDQSPVVLSVEPVLSDTITTVVSFKLKVKDNGATVTVKNRKKKYGPYNIVSFPATIETPAGKFTFSKSDYFKDYVEPFKLNILFTSYDYMAQIYREILEIDFEKKTSDLINLLIDDENVPLAKKIITETINVYNEENVKEKDEVSDKTNLFIKEELSQVYQSLASADKAIQVFKDSYNLTDIEADVTYYFEMNAVLQAKLIEAKTQLKLADIIFDFVSDEKNKFALMPFSLTTLDPSIAEVIGKYNEELLTRNELNKSGVRTSAVVSLEEHLDIQRKNLLQSLTNIKKGMQITVADLNQKENEFNGRIGSIPTVEREYIGLKREQEVQQTILIFLLEKQAETSIKAVSIMPKLKVIDEPYVINKPVKPNLIKVALTLLFFGGCVFPLSAIYLMPYVKNNIRKRKEK